MVNRWPLNIGVGICTPDRNATHYANMSLFGAVDEVSRSPPPAATALGNLLCALGNTSLLFYLVTEHLQPVFVSKYEIENINLARTIYKKNLPPRFCM